MFTLCHISSGFSNQVIFIYKFVTCLLILNFLDFLMTWCWIILVIFIIILSSSDGFPLQVENQSEMLNGKARTVEAISKVNKWIFIKYKFIYIQARTKRFISGNALNIANLIVLEFLPPASDLLALFCWSWTYL